jgi:hypothetical protein
LQWKALEIKKSSLGSSVTWNSSSFCPTQTTFTVEWSNSVLISRGFLSDQKFLNYLKYLEYFKTPEYLRYIRYPICLKILEKLQDADFVE